MLGVAPNRPLPRLAPVISVDLLAALPGSTAEPKTASSAPPAPAPKVQPKPPPKAKKIVLPKQAPKAIPKPKKVARPPKRVKPKELSDAEVMARLRAELGENDPPKQEVLASAEPVAAASAPGALLDPEVARWNSEVLRHVRAGWRTPQEFQDRELVTLVEVQLTAEGRVYAEPRVMKPSGDPFWDDSTVAAILRASPLPPPPEPGRWPFRFASQDRQ